METISLLRGIYTASNQIEDEESSTARLTSNTMIQQQVRISDEDIMLHQTARAILIQIQPQHKMC
jgi:hypothetical protein